jgi:hypothetical protein
MTLTSTPTAGAIPIRIAANSCLLFDRRLYHTATPHWDPAAPVRLACFVGYAHRWLRPKERMYAEPAHAAASCPVLKQLLGHTTSNRGCWRPTVADAPLLGWLRRHEIPPPPAGPARATRWASAPLSRGGRTLREREVEGVLAGDVGHATTSRQLGFEVAWTFQSGGGVSEQKAAL